VRVRGAKERMMLRGAVEAIVSVVEGRNSKGRGGCFMRGIIL
jgi:hypothetical protein